MSGVSQWSVCSSNCCAINLIEDDNSGNDDNNDHDVDDENDDDDIDNATSTSLDHLGPGKKDPFKSPQLQAIQITVLTPSRYRARRM